MPYLLLILLLLFTACGEPEEEVTKAEPPLILSRASFADLQGWAEDDLTRAAEAFKKSCETIIKRPSGRSFGPLEQAGTYDDWQNICKEFLKTAHYDSKTAKTFFEEHFTPYQVAAGEDPKGLFTGYYEASLKGSRQRSEVNHIPLHSRPGDLVMVNLGDFREELKGMRIAGRVVDGNLKPYEDRSEIVAGSWPHNEKVLVWVDDLVDAFFVQIQGSGVVELEDGKTMRIGYAGQNGHPYYAIGRKLIEMGALTKETVSMQAIREWLETHPDQADEIMNTNASYVFFRELNTDGPVGGEGTTLTAGRSLAVDRTKISYGVPLWVEIDPPLEGEEPLKRLMIAQDTGGAIRGAVRGDVFWGYGEQAEYMAGHMKSSGRYWVLLPK